MKLIPWYSRQLVKNINPILSITANNLGVFETHLVKKMI